MDAFDSSPILLPRDYDPVAKLNELEAFNSFLVKNNSFPITETGHHKKKKHSKPKKPQSLAKELAGRRIVRDMQVTVNTLAVIVSLLRGKPQVPIWYCPRHSPSAARLDSFCCEPDGQAPLASGVSDRLLLLSLICVLLQVIGCILLELFMPKRFLSLGRGASLKSRFSIALDIVAKQPDSIPLAIHQTARHLLLPEFGIDASDRFPSVGDLGLPPPSAFQLLMPMTSSLSFPRHFPIFAKILRGLDDITEAYQFSYSAINPDEPQAEAIRLKVRTFRKLNPFFSDLKLS